MKRENLRDALDGDVPADVAHWVVEFHDEMNDRDLTPLKAAQRAYGAVAHGHCCVVTHVRSGLQWSVDLATQEVVEIATLKSGAP